MRHRQFYDLKLNHLLLGLGGIVKPWDEDDHSANDLMTTVFVEQSLALPGSAKDCLTTTQNLKLYICRFVQQVGVLAHCHPHRQMTEI